MSLDRSIDFSQELDLLNSLWKNGKAVLLNTLFLQSFLMMEMISIDNMYLQNMQT